MTTVPGKTLREGSALKREAILGAARDLFLGEGFERTSVDAIASRANVSKRTVYDYFGDKRALLLAVVEQAVGALVIAVQRAMDENLTDVDDLESALIAFAREITTSAIGSSDYAALIRLVSTESANLPELRQHDWGAPEPEDGVASRFADLHARGLLNAPKPRLAADHFLALTLSPARANLDGTLSLAEDDTTERIVEGVRVFLRAYAPER